MNGVSVIICCYNSAARLPATLAHLAVQSTTFPVEIILVDNACSDNTVSVAKASWVASKRTDIIMKVVVEPQPGLSYARDAGIAATSYGIIVFCDDDNHLMPGYLQKAFEIMGTHPEVGLAGGLVAGVFEVPLPSWFVPHAHYLAIGEQGTVDADITDTRGFLFGAGLVLRRTAYLKLKEFGFQPILTGRKGKSLLSGDDTELCIACRLAGARLWYSSQLKLNHFIPASRMTWEYLLNLEYSLGRSSIYFIGYYEHIIKNNPRVARGWKKGWPWQLISTVKEMILLTPKALLGMITTGKGNISIMLWNRMRGRIMEILRRRRLLHDDYIVINKFVDSIREDSVV